MTPQAWRDFWATPHGRESYRRLLLAILTSRPSGEGRVIDLRM